MTIRCMKTNPSPFERFEARSGVVGTSLKVARALPGARRRMVGAWCFLDHAGPAHLPPGEGMFVGPHPHIGLATVTYLFDGAMQHRDSTGVVQRIEPGAVNLMIAGRGVVHSERTPDDLRSATRRSHGLQLWLALPEADEDIEPSFSHTPETAIPRWAKGGVSARVLIGSAWGASSPVPTCSPTLYIDLQLARGAQLTLPSQWAEKRALYAVDGACTAGGQKIAAQTMAVLPAGQDVQLSADDNTRCVLIGGAPLGQRFMWWNFVSSRKERILQAAQAWATQPNEVFPQVEGETEFISLPEPHPA